MNKKHICFKRILSILLIIGVFPCVLLWSCNVHYKKEKQYPVDRVMIYGREYKNIDEIIWQDGLMLFDFVWVLEKTNITLFWSDNKGSFYLNGTEYILDIDKAILIERNNDKLDYFAPGAGYHFVGIINKKLYIDTITLIFAMHRLNLFVSVENDIRNNPVRITRIGKTSI